ncbi:unnamed protein product [Phytophthora fragariaefolia]|uniref:Unnamed protein product n=1 Tax=Phytophthora fragariaefolia TaxID=1490495 RepID=A0A9W6YH44_9STRA|nr:unnamed protein product [Phytophthora fragariaefolia]
MRPPSPYVRLSNPFIQLLGLDPSKSRPKSTGCLAPISLVDLDSRPLGSRNRPCHPSSAPQLYACQTCQLPSTCPQSPRHSSVLGSGPSVTIINQWHGPDPSAPISESTASPQSASEEGQVLERYCMKRESGAFVNKAPACTKKVLKKMMTYLYSSASSTVDYQDAALLCLLWFLFRRASDLTQLRKANLSICFGDIFFARFIRVKTSEEQGLNLFRRRLGGRSTANFNRANASISRTSVKFHGLRVYLVDNDWNFKSVLLGTRKFTPAYGDRDGGIQAPFLCWIKRTCGEAVLSEIYAEGSRRCHRFIIMTDGPDPSAELCLGDCEQVEGS